MDHRRCDLVTALLVLFLESSTLLLANTHGAWDDRGLMWRNRQAELEGSAGDLFCPGYVRGVNPRNRNSTGCETGTKLGAVDHEQAFGFPPNAVDWSYCYLPVFPGENHKVCYKTAIDKCSNEYRVYLNKRGLSRTCNDSHVLAENGDSKIFFESPRYKCERKKGRYFTYRRSDLCLYNISITDCESGRVIIEHPERDEPSLEKRNSDGICADYLQFYYDSYNSRTARFCGTELGNSSVIPATQFLAVFWTDIKNNTAGFSLRARCQESVSNSDQIMPYNETDQRY